MRPAADETICDPACGTGGFLLAAHDYVAEHHAEPRPGPEEAPARSTSLHGWEIVDSTARLCAMNLFLHGIGRRTATSPITVDDASRGDPGERFDVVLTNPPFGKKSSHGDRRRGGRGRARGR